MVTENDILLSEGELIELKGALKGSNSAGTADVAITTSSTYFSGANLGIMVEVGGQIYIESHQTNQTNTSVVIHGEIFICMVKVTDDVIKVKRGGGDGTFSTNVTADSGSTLNWVRLDIPKGNHLTWVKRTSWINSRKKEN